MANTLSRQEVKRLALIGAQQRLDELRAEIASLLKAFPELAKSGATKRGRPAAAATAAAATAAGAAKRSRKRRRNTMSADQKQAVSDRMKKYWAARRKESGKKA